MLPRYAAPEIDLQLPSCLIKKKTMNFIKNETRGNGEERRQRNRWETDNPFEILGRMEGEETRETQVRIPYPGSKKTSKNKKTKLQQTKDEKRTNIECIGL